MSSSGDWTDHWYSSYLSAVRAVNRFFFLFLFDFFFFVLLNLPGPPCEIDESCKGAENNAIHTFTQDGRGPPAREPAKRARLFRRIMRGEVVTK